MSVKDKKRGCGRCVLNSRLIT